MLLVDTSIWVDHLRAGEPDLREALERGRVAMHSWVLGELACGHLRQREVLLSLLAGLPKLTVATDQEVLYLIETSQLMGRGIGYVDVHLLAACLLNQARLWTRDQRLARVAAELDLVAVIP